MVVTWHAADRALQCAGGADPSAEVPQPRPEAARGGLPAQTLPPAAAWGDSGVCAASSADKAYDVTVQQPRPHNILHDLPTALVNSTGNK